MRFQVIGCGVSRSLVLFALGMGVLSPSLACSVASGGPAENVSTTGTLQLALSARSNAGTNYHLTNASFNVTGTTSDTLSGDDAVLREDLPAGSYAIQLVDGWTLNSVAADGWRSMPS